MSSATKSPFIAHSKWTHPERRIQILEQHPEIRKLYGPDPWMAVDCLVRGLFVILLAACWAPTLSSPMYWLSCWAIAGTVNHTIALALHEVSHNLAFKGIFANQILLLIGNWAMGLPTAMSFQKYHRRHHEYISVYAMDTDIPSLWEVALFQKSRLLKLVWVFLQPAFYALRPFLVDPQPATAWELANWVSCILFNYALYSVAGIWAVVWLAAGSFLGMGLHPLAGHFIAEHYHFVDDKNQRVPETFSYYGFWNLLAYNVGYHVEHHDFRFVNHNNLPKIRAIAPEWYNNLPHHTSYVRVIWDFIMRDDMGLHRRMVYPESLLSAGKKNSGAGQPLDQELAAPSTSAQKKST
eukprot:ANDGO_04772.mRNA.1 Putative sphingolipid delta(4)-desaturase